MTDITKYKNVSLSKEAYEQLKKQSKQVTDVELSISKTVELASNVLQGIIEAFTVSLMDAIFTNR